METKDIYLIVYKVGLIEHTQGFWVQIQLSAVACTSLSRSFRL